VGWPSRDLVAAARQQITHEWWEKRRQEFDLYTSEFVIREVSRGNHQLAQQRLEILSGVTLLHATGEIQQLAKELIAEGSIPQKAADDAAHIAVATVFRCEYLLTWNCRHIANAELFGGLRRVLQRYDDYELPSLCTPQQLMGENYGTEGSGPNP
jgi:hypothetical protein